MDSRPGYFDVTIRNSLQPSYILKTAICLGAAAEAAEFEKDARHEANVTTAGGLFYPLVFESLGYISSFTRKTLKGICSKTSSISGILFPRAFKNILEQSSLTLGCYDAKMLHARMQ